MRYVRPLFAFFLIFLMAAPFAADAARAKVKRVARAPQRVSSASGLSDPRYAALIMNPETGEVYSSRDADGRRYPASLTKMMTLYLLFDALEQKKVSLGTQFDVSEYASTMPQTNLALNPGDRIPVDTAIKALVVRSANDVAVVVGENLGGSASRFAGMMTAKARALGMSNTVFKNPNGLPNDDQYTTARDMAKLGIALKRDFPQYYPYFSVRQFSWNGATYYTHNRVMLRYSGVDGIKTGFIGKSGFNLVTSCVRGGRPLIGVVLGGTSGRWRDDQMINLLDGGYKIIAERGQHSGRVYAANLPTPRGGVAPKTAPPQAQVIASVTEANAMATTLPDVADGEDEPTDNAPAMTPIAVEQQASTVAMATLPTAMPEPAVKPAPAVKSAPAPVKTAVVKTPFVTPPSKPLAPVAPVKPAGGLTQAGQADIAWGIQVGAFSSQELAVQAVRQAVSQAHSSLQNSRMSVIGAGQPGSTIHRARLENLSENQARKACEMLISKNSPCFIFRADSQNL